MVRISSEKMVKLKKHKSLLNKHFWRDKCVEFCKRTDLHGYKYIVMEGFNKVERVCWAFSVFVSMVIAIYFVVTAYMWYAKNPIVTVIESTQGAIWDVPFPAITICDLNLVSRKAAWDLANSLRLPANVTIDFVFETLRLIPLLHTAFKANTTEMEQLNQLQDILDFNYMTVRSLFQKLSPGGSCSQLVQSCMWKNTIYRCDELFREIFTLLSVCCTFNYFAIDEKIGNEQEPTPRRVASCGYQTALTVLLYTNTDDYYSATVASQGVVVIIESAYNVPDLDSPVRMVVPSTEVLIGLSPERTYATPGIKTFRPEERQCYYSDEIKIDNFREYSFHNCMAHRKIQMYKRKCGCVPLFLPSDDTTFSVSSRNCNFKDMECMQSASESLEQDYINHNLSEGDTIFFKCLPQCEHYDYPLEVALSKLADNVINGLPINNATSLNSSLLNVFFNDLVSTRYRRDVYLNWQNILSAFGGLLSLMLGFTLISGFDSIMFFTVRVVYSAYKSWLNDKKVHTEVNMQDVPIKGGWVPRAGHNKVNQKYSNDYYDYGRY